MIQSRSCVVVPESEPEKAFGSGGRHGSATVRGKEIGIPPCRLTNRWIMEDRDARATHVIHGRHSRGNAPPRRSARIAERFPGPCPTARGGAGVHRRYRYPELRPHP